MIARIPLLPLSVVLDVVGVLLGGLLAALALQHDPALILQGNGLAFVAAFLLLGWFLGNYSFLRWPWMPYRQLVQRFVLVLLAALGLAITVGWLLNSPPTAIWSHRSTLLILGLVLAGWGLAQRLWLLPVARRQAAAWLQASPVRQIRPGHQPVAAFKCDVGVPPQRQLLLLLVAYHPSPLEVEHLQACLEALPPQVGYAVVVNDYHHGEAVERLAAGADCFLTNTDNLGYGRAVNRLVVRLGELPPYIGVLNTDLAWQPGSFEQVLAWLQQHPDVSLAVPQILDEQGEPQRLCKHNPTLLGLLSRRFVPSWLKPSWLKRYDRWYVMAEQDYTSVFDAPYLSGCCMVIRSDAFRRVGGFDERYFLYLEDADLTRSLAREGRCVHLPVAGVVHGWGRGNYRNLGLMAVNLASAWHYFRKWGWVLW
jgi:GT2 family glycosyltransferase